MSLFWIAKIADGETTYFLPEANTPLYASLRSAIAGHDGKPTDIIALDAKTARKVPKKLIGRILTQREAEALLKKLL